MHDAPVDEPIQDADDDLAADKRGGAPSTDDEEQPSIVAGVGSSALGSAEIEPQRDRHPDNDGETVEE